MIRAALVSIVFLGLMLSLILMQPRSNQVTQTEQLNAQAIVEQARSEYDALNADETPVATQSATAAPEPAPEPFVVEVEPAPLPVAVAEFQYTTSSVPQRMTLEQQIIEAVQQGQSEAYILELVKQATVSDQVTEQVTRDSNAHTNAFLSLLDRDVPDTVPALADARRYVVQPGDSLASISRLFYNDTGGAFDIYTANRDMLGRPDNIVVGQELLIPIR